jgi:hypothetical protein
MHDGINNYIKYGCVPGGFLSAIISDSLSGAVLHADDNNLRSLVVYAVWFYNFAPRECYGSKKKMRAWEKAGGLEGLEAKDEREAAHKKSS